MHNDVKLSIFSASCAGRAQRKKSNSTAFPLAPKGAQKFFEARRGKPTRPLCGKPTAHEKTKGRAEKQSG